VAHPKGKELESFIESAEFLTKFAYAEFLTKPRGALLGFRHI